MSIKDLAVHVDHSEHCKPGLEVAIALAERTGAHLSAIYVDPIPVSPELVAMSTAPVLLESVFEEQEQRARRSKALYEAAIAGRQVAGEWRKAEGPMYDALSVHARHADMLVVTQEGDGSSAPVLGGFAETAMIESGRPALVVPYIGASEPVGGKVLVAWNGTRQAARAANDGIVLMQLAREVEVVSIRPEEGELAGAPLPGADLCLHLARHGIAAEARVITGIDVGAPELLLSHAADSGANLIVMGGYGHSRLRELVLGGMTRSILAHMTVPVLMSH